jgi:hypothetical protein
MDKKEKLVKLFSLILKSSISSTVHRNGQRPFSGVLKYPNVVQK